MRYEQLRQHNRLYVGELVANHMIISVDSWLPLAHLTEDGRQALIDLKLSGEVIAGAFQNYSDGSFDILPITSGTIALYAHNRVLEAARDNDSLALALLNLIGSEELLLLSKLALLLQRQGLVRLAVFLLRIHDRLDRIGLVENGSFALPLNQQLIDSLIGLHEVHVSRLMNRLEGGAFIERRGTRIPITSRDRLCNVGRKGD